MATGSHMLRPDIRMTWDKREQAMDDTDENQQYENHKEYVAGSTGFYVMSFVVVFPLNDQGH